MNLGLRSRLFLASLGLIALSVSVAYVYARTETEREARERIESDLVVRLQLVVARAEVFDEPLTALSAWDGLADRLGETAHGRVTFISRGGRVVGDSMVPLEELERTDNHRLRPEVQMALRGRTGRAQRLSATTGRHMLYVAHPLHRGDTEIGVARVALPTTKVDAALAALRRVLIVASLLALGVSVIVAFGAVHVASSGLSSLTRAASRMAAGDLAVRARVAGTGEFAELGRALDRLAKNLSSTLGALKEERDRLRGILSSMEEGVLFLDESGKVALVNPALRDMLLLSDEPTGRSLLEVVRHAELKEMLDAALEEDEEELAGPVQGEIRVSGLRPRQLLVRAKKLEGVTAGVVAIFLDVTETRKLENLRREFVANVSHELRTPVTSIRSAAETLGSAVESKPEMVKRFVEIIDRNAARLHALVEDVLDLSRIESRQFSLTLSSLLPEDIMGHVAALFEERAAKRDVEIALDVPDGLLPVRADRRALEHVLSNLVDNAVKYAGPGKYVRLSARQQGDDIQLTVEDNGPGIDEKHLPRIFERFYRVDAGRSRDLGGTGLGLSIVKNMVESMSGNVTVRSEVGKGTSFTISLPAVRRPSTQPPPR